MPKMPTPELPRPAAAPPARPLGLAPALLQSPLRFCRPGYKPPPSLPTGAPEDRFAQEWYAPQKPLLPPAVQTLPRRWELAFPSQLLDWRRRSLALVESSKTWDHGMIAGQTWMFPVSIPEGEAMVLSGDTPTIQAKQRLVLVCLPPQVILQEGDRVAVSDPRDLERPVNASRMPQEVLTVPPGPRLLLAHELESLAWAASEDREALVGELLD